MNLLFLWIFLFFVCISVIEVDGVVEEAAINNYLEIMKKAADMYRTESSSEVQVNVFLIFWYIN